MAKPEVVEKIREQRGFLERSLADFLNGHEEEAVRIATSIRVLVHEGRGKPLLKSFKPNYLELPILNNNVHEPRPGEKILARFAPVMISKGGVQPITDLSNTKETTIGKWWLRPCVTATTPEGRTIDFTRSDIIRTLADKEGGAHVDEDLPEDYCRYILGADIVTFNSRQELGTVHQARFVAAESASHMIDCLGRILRGN
jgi:hypothetical protein